MNGCSHGKTFKEPCVECQLVLARERLALAQQHVEKYSKLIAELGLAIVGDNRAEIEYEDSQGY